MVKSHRNRGVLLTSNLPQLQNLIKVSFPTTSSLLADTITQRDPTGYREEFLAQHNHYLSLLRLQFLAPSTSASTPIIGKDKSIELFADLITFICQVAQYYPTETKELPAQLRDLLLGGSSAGGGIGGGSKAKGELRRTVVKNLVMLRNKEVIDSIECVWLSLVRSRSS